MTENREKLLEEIKGQGDLVRQLKAAKESKEKVRFFFLLHNRQRSCKFFVFFKRLSEKMSVSCGYFSLVETRKKTRGEGLRLEMCN